MQAASNEFKISTCSLYLCVYDIYMLIIRSILLIYRVCVLFPICKNMTVKVVDFGNLLEMSFITASVTSQFSSDTYVQLTQLLFCLYSFLMV